MVIYKKTSYRSKMLFNRKTVPNRELLMRQIETRYIMKMKKWKRKKKMNLSVVMMRGKNATKAIKTSRLDQENQL